MNIREISEALVNGVGSNEEMRFWPKKYANVNDPDHTSNFRGEINYSLMVKLKERVDEIFKDYKKITRGMIMTPEQQDLSKIMYIYNYILGNVRYTMVQFVKNTSNVFGGHPYKSSSYGALVMHDAVCSGISDGVACLCAVFGLECYKLLTNPTDPYGGGHAYNLVKIGNDWYGLDATMEIGCNPGHTIRGGKWKDRCFLVPYSSNEQNIANCTKLYPRDLILQMKKRLSSKGLSFEYQTGSILKGDEIKREVQRFVSENIKDPSKTSFENFENEILQTLENSKKLKESSSLKEIMRVFSNSKHFVAYQGNDCVELTPLANSKFVIKRRSSDQLQGFRILSKNGTKCANLETELSNNVANLESFFENLLDDSRPIIRKQLILKRKI